MEKPTENEIRSSSGDSLIYSGNVKVTVMDGDDVIYQTSSHNNGMPTLFNFFIDCLAGDFNAAKSGRPCRLVMFALADGETPDTFNSAYWTSDQVASTKVLYDRAIPSFDSDNCSITFHFRAPFICLQGNKKIRKLGLYPNLIENYSTDLCAYHFLPTDVEVPSAGGNFTIVVD